MHARTSRTVVVLALASLVSAMRPAGTTPAGGVQFVFTSDAHYGLTRPSFRHASQVSARIVNQALVRAINAVPNLRFPDDGGVRAGERVGALDFVAEGGDVANRQETDGDASIQPASVSWAQFLEDYEGGLTVPGRETPRAPLYVVPGNHDASNAVGFYKPMTPARDVSSIVGIYNLMMKPEHRSPTSYDYERDRVLTSRDVSGVHFVFLMIWPDSAARAWLDVNLASVPASTPVVVVTHDQPDAESKHFRNPNGTHDINPRDRFENLLADSLADGSSIMAPDTLEQRELERFLSRHPNITAYFHGNSNWHQAYDWHGPDGTARLHTFRVDSPMKGARSASNETVLSFHVAAIDPSAHHLTVRECLWNADPARPDSVRWGASNTVVLGAVAEEAWPSKAASER